MIRDRRDDGRFGLSQWVPSTAVGHWSPQTNRMADEVGRPSVAATARRVGIVTPYVDALNRPIRQSVEAARLFVEERFGRLDVLVNNAAEQHTTERITEISAEQLERTFRTNIFAMFFLTKAALPHLGEGSAIVNTTSVTAYQGNPALLDYSSTKGAIVAFTRSLSQQLVGQGIRVNAVAPGPIWTPLIPATMPEEKVASFGKDVPMGRPGQPEEVAPCYLFLASDDAAYMAGQVLHPNGGNVVNG